ncbi:MAG: adenylate/guanylate cyclase domain-containing protein [Candidatus Competibacterales bacterium]
MSQQSADRGETTLAVMFVDICNSTGLFAQYGDALALEKIKQCLDELEVIIAANAGWVIQSQGDGILCAFDQVENAFGAAKAILEARPQRQLSIHAGLHWGPVIARDDSVFGDAVNLAKRLTDEAKVDEILLSAETAGHLPPNLGGDVRALGKVRLKGIPQPVMVYSLMLREEDVTFFQTKLDDVPQAPCALLLEWGEQRCLLQGPVQGFIVGRDEEPHSGDATAEVEREGFSEPSPPPLGQVKVRSGKGKFVVNHSYASRHHGTIETRGGKFFWVDRSTNGTCVVDDQGHMTFLRRGDVIQLSGQGTISLGAEPEKTPLPLHYRETEQKR